MFPDVTNMNANTVWVIVTALVVTAIWLVAENWPDKPKNR